MRIYQRVWSIDPAEWSVDYQAECVALLPDDVDAALQISAHRKVPGPLPFEEVREMAQEDEAQFGGQLVPATCGHFSGLTLEFVEGHTFWRRWWLTNGCTLLYVTYNSEYAQHDVHRDIVDRMLATLEAHEPQSGADAREQGN
jgi:hypothetical protein